ncbi:hypothetical protein [Streptomyces sp. NPDC005953]|uniref:hypothetical protein n=1 Tax=Streptomyces sp. NPDC005953 TaxID=3156719 RepID=UPI0033D5B053
MWISRRKYRRLQARVKALEVALEHARRQLGARRHDTAYVRQLAAELADQQAADRIRGEAGR